ncbi:zinc finger protein 830 [Anabrus simplex]|uniref:zinc finger protein 830 n=1 Tax=Anabrus simplex TaxID=316456 RepID=UPI0035A26F24
MSTSLNLGKKKVTQNDLRRIMNEQKRILSQTVKKIESPLAKYSPTGQLTCIVCDHVVRNESVWAVHINSKQHKDNIQLIKRKKESENLFKKPVAPGPLPSSLKRPSSYEVPSPPKKIKGILKNAPPSKVPSDFFDSSDSISLNSNGPVTASDVNALQKLAAENDDSGGESEEEEESIAEKTPPTTDIKSLKPQNVDEVLPEGFFDDPMLDAKARNVEYKDPIEEEWEKFQKAMKEETTVSAQIIADDQEVATAERQIDEIDEQLRNWSRVLDLEKKKEEVVQAASSREGGENDDELSSGDEAEFDEYLDWRAKKSYK